MFDTNSLYGGCSAASVVLSIPELLEQILLYLPQKDILLSQRTSSSFRHTTLGSLRLQRALLLAPDWSLSARTFNMYSAENKPGPKPENNRLLLRTFSGCYPTVTLVIVNDALSSTNSSGGGPPVVHELGAAGRRRSEHWSWDVCIAFPADQMPQTSNPAVFYPEASWRRMYLSQPPCKSLHLVRRWQRSRRPGIERENGITMGDVYDENIKMQKYLQTEGLENQRAEDGMPVPRSPSSQEGVPKWHKSFISSDRDWHFEGNIQCSSVEESPTVTKEALERFAGYAYSRSLRNGAVRALSDDWDPGRTAQWAARAML